MSKTFTPSKCIVVAALLFVVASPAATEPGGDALIRELNVLRANPAGYASKLQYRRKFYKGRIVRLPGKIGEMTNEGVPALDEAVRVLRSTKPLPLVSSSEALAKAAHDLVEDIGPKGRTSHEGSDGSTPRTRIGRYAKDVHSTAEVISFGPEDAESVIVDLLIDDGVRDRGHRKILLAGGYRAAGASCGNHKTFRVVCVVDFADQVR